MHLITAKTNRQTEDMHMKRGTCEQVPLTRKQCIACIGQYPSSSIVSATFLKPAILAPRT